ncbi:hypothetical protein EV644_101664 [Kribbella orskensis]|uniref:Uncharacterized protein n=1 Tax=Kribbella orskensis TaxID=2512216 RepID=A0ABY2BVL9_9ACTN|nr:MULTISPECIES: hypothetical protein [Kribbella]TCN44201.1 hypothetical protein EV642_101325 [Kribbella sp. VKM Ac-2500]TCO32021.1 hypothetical protein EV644_101664 [Kribbella orskensis]
MTPIRAIASAFDEIGGGRTAGLHAVNALIIMALVGRILRQARELAGSPPSLHPSSF